MTPEQRVDAIMAKYGMPTKLDALRALLLFTYQQGKCDGAEQASIIFQQTLSNGTGERVTV